LRAAPSAQDVLAGFTISIDGPSGSGKTTTARLVARELGFHHLDTGAMYRVVTLCALERGVDTGNAEGLGALADSLDVSFAVNGDGTQRVFAAGRDVSDAIRTPAVTAAVSAVSAHRAVRRAMVRRQRVLAERGGVILEGRDIGSVVLPWADVKIYLDASVMVRAQRRHAELAAAGTATTVDDVARDLERRDALDASREASPLVRPIGAWLVDTSDVTIAQQVARVVELARDEAATRARALAQSGASQRKRVKWRVCTGLAAAWFHVMFGMRVIRVYRGEPDQNYLFASNHISNADPPAVSCRLFREVHFVAKASLFKVPLLGPLIRWVNAFPIRRGVFDREAMSEALRLLKANRSVLIFPEGGRVSGPELGKPKSGVGFLAVQTGVPIVPVYVENTDRLRACLIRRRRVRVTHGRPIRIPAALRDEVRAMDERTAYRRVSEMVMAAIQAVRESAPGPR